MLDEVKYVSLLAWHIIFQIYTTYIKTLTLYVNYQNHFELNGTVISKHKLSLYSS